MKQKAEVGAFKKELSNYNFYQERIKKLNELIEYCYHMLGGYKGLDPTKEPTHTPPNKDNEYRIRDEIERHERNKARTQEKINDINEVLSKIDVGLREAVIEVYANGRTIESVARGMFLSGEGLRKRMNKAIEKALT